MLFRSYDVRMPQTNMVYVQVPDAAAMQAALEDKGVRCLPTGPTTLRLVTHLDVDSDGIEQAVTAFAELEPTARPLPG